MSAYAASFAKSCAHPIPALLDAAGVAPGLRLLDVGTGCGSVAAAAAERGARVTAVDAQPDMVAWTAQAVPAADVQVAALPHLLYRDGTFDATVANFVLNQRVECRTLAWNHRSSLQEWWSSPASGVASAGQILASCPPEVVATAKEHYIRLSSEFADRHGQLVLPHRALLAVASV